MRTLATIPAPARRPIALAAACAAALLPFLALSASADAKSGRWVVKGAGYGHGIGMSQYGAFGSAKAGMNYRAILKQYYTGTTLGTSPSKPIRVLLRPYQASVRFKGASAACGAALSEGKTYSAKRKGSKVILRNKGGARIANCGGLLSATGGDSVTLIGKGAYRGALEVRPSTVPGRLNAINAVDIESYLRGVVAEESPSSWPLEALKAQAVAARSYALTTGVGGNGFDAYDDTRSQVYGGIAAEAARTDQAVSGTANEVVLYNGTVAETFFMSTSGGHTENNENSFLGGIPEPYLRGVQDPNEAAAGSPYHRWTRKFSRASMQAELSGIVKGRLKRIVIARRGVSPRIIKAKIIGSAGVSTASGPTLRARLGLPDTWANFKLK
ncbi:MAG TPA: SpoIID/LytB domain-containing protein [Solirubrobacterales bacterium]|jgi:stage II sporulation protein D|nr:SpoIID/LytB domain-containing protein [Solirubrobacterales bacterium]